MMPSENGEERYSYHEIAAIKDLVNEGVKKGSPGFFNVTDASERSILAMARSSDPFYSGQDYQVGPAKWFAELHRSVGSRRLHIRSLFYIAVGDDRNLETGEYEVRSHPVTGEPFDKTVENWLAFQEWSKWARNMELVEADRIMDFDSYKAHLYAPTYPPPEPSLELQAPSITLPTNPGGVFGSRSRITYASGNVAGYERHRVRVPSIVEVWVEKQLDSADEPVVKNVCSSLGVNLIVGSGFMTISCVHDLLRRQSEHGKPVRVLYLSDFDDAGEHMPVGPARHIEYAIRLMEEKPDIRLYQLALNTEQVSAGSEPFVEGIPRKPPTKKSEEETREDGRKKRWEERRGEGTVQLNALTDPARVEEFERLLRSTILSLRDGSIDRKLREKRREAQELVEQELARKMHWTHKAFDLIGSRADATTQEILGRQQEQRRELGEQMEELMRQYNECQRQVRELDREIERELEPLEERAERVGLLGRVRVERLEEEIDLPKVVPEEPEGAAEGWLFDSRRGYFVQRAHYNSHKGANGSAGRDPELLDTIVEEWREEQEALRQIGGRP